jgi:hypothetical protein
VHGCSLFTRGETQAIAVVTLGGESDAQRIDELTDPDTKTRRFYLNYFFPPSCVGEVRGARGALSAVKALRRLFSLLTHALLTLSSAPPCARAADGSHGWRQPPRAWARQPGGARAAAHPALWGRRASRACPRLLRMERSALAS